MADKKDTIYIDIDDEITAIIDKLSKSDSKIVALVLPKRATALQSIVNMKLLKRAADENGKSPVLITSEKGLLPLAGATGLYVAKNLNSKPEIPAAPDKQQVDDEELEAELEPEEEQKAGKAAAVGALAGAAAASDTIDMENEEPVSASTKSATSPKAKKPKGAKGSKTPKIPNFDKFRKKIFLIVGAVVGVIALFILAVVVLPKATITIETNTESIDTGFEFTVDPAATQVDESAMVVPGTVATEKVNETQTAPATGQKDLGTKASGNMTFSIPCSAVSGSPPTIPAGTGVSAGGLTYLTQNNSALTTPNFNGGCNFTGTTTVVAQNNGDQYNKGATSYSVAGFSNVSASGSAMTGGTTKMARVVTAQDVETAKSKISSKDEGIKKRLEQELEKDNLFIIQGSFQKANESTTPSPAVDQEASEVKVTYTADYTLVGVNRDNLKQLVEVSLKDKIDSERQQVQEDGLEQATFSVKSIEANGNAIIAVSTKAEVGPDIDTNALKEEIRGKKSGETENIVKALPGVKNVEVDYSPFWVSRTPKKASKITIEFKSANQ
jgi:hypothetical protein